MCGDPAGCDSLPVPICSDSSCCVHGGNMTAADVQRRHEWSHLLCLAASTNSLHIPYLLPRSADNRRYIYSSWQYWLCGNTAVLWLKAAVRYILHPGGVIGGIDVTGSVNQTVLYLLLQTGSSEDAWDKYFVVVLNLSWDGKVFKHRCHRKCENGATVEIKRIQCLSPNLTSFFREAACKLCNSLPPTNLTVLTFPPLCELPFSSATVT